MAVAKVQVLVEQAGLAVVVRDKLLAMELLERLILVVVAVALVKTMLAAYMAAMAAQELLFLDGQAH